MMLPMLLVGLLYILNASYMDGNRTIHDLIFNNNERYQNVVNNLLLWRNGFPSYGHSWYIYIYMLVMLAFPALKGVVTYTDQIHKRKYRLVCGIFAFLAANDFSCNKLASFSHYMFNGLCAATLVIFVGYYLYQSREVFAKKKYIIIAPVVFLMVNLLRETVQLFRESAGYGDDTSIMYWYSVFGVIAASCVLVFCVALIPNKKTTKCNNLIVCLASYTFPIYLIHALIINLLNSVGLISDLQNRILTWNSGVTGETVYTIIIMSCVFWGSFFTVYIFRLIYSMSVKYMKLFISKADIFP